MRNWIKSGDPWVWLTAGSLAVSIVMVLGLIVLIAFRGFGHFWPDDVVQTHVTAKDGTRVRIIGEIEKSETVTAAVVKDLGFDVPDGEIITRYLMKHGNRDVSGRDFVWYLDNAMESWSYPDDIIVLERREWGNFYGYPLRIEQAGVVAVEGEAVWEELAARVERSRALFDEIEDTEKHRIGGVNYRQEQARLAERALELDGTLSEAEKAARLKKISLEKTSLDNEYASYLGRLSRLNDEIKRDVLVAEVMDGKTVKIPLEKIVRFTRPNIMGFTDKLGYYFSKLREFLTGEPRESNTEGGIFPAIFGTITMVFLMSILVTPFGVLAAIYLHEYARQGIVMKLIRVSVYNLAGVPSIVYGVFGLGFFVYFIGGSIDELFYPERLPAPTFGTGGLMWASLTLALLTLPVVIVSTEEGLARIPSSVRHGSYALGATKAETLWRVVVPLAVPAMMTGMILAVARAAGEVAPLMLVGVVKMAPSLPVDGYFPYVHLDSKIMHLGFHIYDVGFQSPNVEAARPLLYATALALVAMILVLNILAITVRNRLRERYKSQGE